MTGSAPDSSAEKMRNRAALIELIGGYITAHSVGLAAELGIADLIQDGMCTSSELAEATGSHEQSMRRLLRALAAIGITTEPEPGRFGLTEIGAQLCADSPNSLYAFARAFCHDMFFTAWQGLRHTIKTGDCAFDRVFGKDFYSYVAEQPQLSALFNEAMSQESRISAELLATAYDFSSVKTVVDIGGGDGTLLATILAAHPHLHGIVFDSPSGVANAGVVLARAGVADRAEARGGDFFQSVPPEGDLYLIKSVFQDWDDESARTILRTCRSHLAESAVLLIVGSLLPETAAPNATVEFFTDLNMMVMAGGQERTENEFRELLKDTGFTVQSVAHGAAGPLSIIQAAPAAV